MNPIVVGALLGAVGVVAGAFGAHALRERLSAEALGWWETASRYELIHALALVLTGLLARQRGQALPLPATLFLVGTLVFAGTLYAMALGAPRWLGAITPLGGAALIGGWITLAL
ncbi:MAG TPA: DUF423 domain-containing protein, partial [Planctomycetota bacterium]|nr:DUF423 domain-containing protein [Planctomycetota bacterium]